jgi:hypothetical protein
LLLVLQRLVQLRVDQVPDGDPESTPDPDHRDAEVGGHGRVASGSHDQGRFDSTLVILKPIAAQLDRLLDRPTQFFAGKLRCG